jgi:hypothetical protein
MEQEIAIEDLFCKIYVLSELNRFQLAELLGTRLNAEVDGKFVSINTLEIEFRENEDFDPEKCEALDFLFYPVYLEVEPKPDVKPMDYIHDIGTVLTCLRENGCKATAACDFEDYLPTEVNVT